eukprot:CAMPEP_0204902278 /NCGR_PEP_ID=MMETSP1397-20131031/3571_1 /ASSEMBLY_ACC=CAM_ASM_000891 /TAXON_ID=49980 /ORGANISM="Climacostomum Climacostomum virens, Strain Stock W-24" /LENGTH=141 /DNA_ID=CAMNT_0052070755 /DNA_START=1153 /DNA_END=1577 /DNA_ORIENTATION=+
MSSKKFGTATAESLNTLEKTLEALAKKLKVKAKKSNDFADLKNSLNALGKVLLVLDNVTESLKANYLGCRKKEVHLIAAYQEAGRLENSFTIGGLAHEEALNLVMKKLRVEDASEGLGELVDQLERLPGQLIKAADFIMSV